MSDRQSVRSRIIQYLRLKSAESSASVEGHLYKGEIKGRRGNAEELENTSLSYSVCHVMRNCFLGSTCIEKSY